MSEVSDFTRDELYNIATEVDLTGRSSMTKAELFTALEDEAPHILDPFAAADTVRPGDTVSMNHLKSDLTVTMVRKFTGDQVVTVYREAGELRADADEVTEVPDEVGPYTVIIMETNRGGRHSLVCRKASEVGPTPWKNADEPHLRRWRAGDQEWMNNSTDPVFIRPVTEDDE